MDYMNVEHYDFEIRVKDPKRARRDIKEIGKITSINADYIIAEFILNDDLGILCLHIKLEELNDVYSVSENDLNKIIEIQNQEKIKALENPEEYYSLKLPDLGFNGKQLFDGWYTDPEFKNRIYSLNLKDDEDVDLYLKWVDVIVVEGDQNETFS